jgi:hypothetical protein
MAQTGEDMNISIKSSMESISDSIFLLAMRIHAKKLGGAWL